MGYSSPLMSAPRILVAGALLSLVPLACGKRSGTSVEPRLLEDQPNPSASVVSVAVEMGACPDFVVCERECDAGSADRCRRLAASYEFGKGAPADPKLATSLYVRACDMRDMGACVSAGRMYEFHHGVEKDDRTASSFYRRACDGENMTGCANLAIMLESGHGGDKDDGAAIQLFDKACARGSGIACQHAAALRAVETRGRSGRESD
jgi:TPR repeat protein